MASEVVASEDKKLNRLLGVWVQVGSHLDEPARNVLLQAIYAEVGLTYPFPEGEATALQFPEHPDTSE